MKVFGHSYECYVPDSQLIFPCIFLREVERLPRHTRLFNRCFELMRQHCEFKILPSIKSDLSSKILTGFREFLRDIRSEISRARNSGISERDFYRKVKGILKSKSDSYGDLIYYWDAEKEQFWKYVSMDPNIVNKEMIDLTMRWQWLLASS